MSLVRIKIIVYLIKGLRPYQAHTHPKFADPDEAMCKLFVPSMHLLDHFTSAIVLGLSFAGRWYAPKIGITRVPFTVSILCKL